MFFYIQTTSFARLCHHPPSQKSADFGVSMRKEGWTPPKRKDQRAGAEAPSRDGVRASFLAIHALIISFCLTRQGMRPQRGLTLPKGLRRSRPPRCKGGCDLPAKESALVVGQSPWALRAEAEHPRGTSARAGLCDGVVQGSGETSRKCSGEAAALERVLKSGP